LVSLGVLVAAVAGQPLWRRLPLPGCWFHEWTGRPCPGCGLTRAFLALGRGDWAAAWRWNPFVWPVLGLVALTLLDGVLPWRRWVAPRWRSRGAAALAATWLGWGAWRALGGC
jgi:hypothetical protein